MPANPITAQAIIFAINAGIKLSRGIQKAFAKSIKAKAIVLPLPKFDASADVISAHAFFRKGEGQKFIAYLGKGEDFTVYIEHLDYLYRKYEHHKGRTKSPSDDFANDPLFSINDEQEYITYYKSFNALVKRIKAQTDESQDLGYSDQDFIHLLRIRQWEKRKMPGSSPLQLVAGSLVEIGIDYFNQVPGALNKGSSFGVVMQHVLQGFDDVKFADTSLKGIGETVIPRLFIAAAEAVNEMSTSISKDPNIQLFIQETSKGVSEDLIDRLKKIEKNGTLNATEKHQEKKQILKWGQVLSHSLIKNAGSYVFTHPAELLDTNEGGSQVIHKIGDILLDAIFVEGSDNIHIQAAFNVHTLDKVVSATMQVVAQYPYLVSNRDGIKEIVIGVSQAIADNGIKKPGLLPELIRLILELTADNLPVLWPDHKNLDSKHLLLIATQNILEAISRPTPNRDWRLELSSNTIVLIAENILDEVIQNPHWVTSKGDNPTVLQEVLDAVFIALGQIPKEERLSPQIINYVIQVSLRAAATSHQVLEAIHWSDNTTEKNILEKSLSLLTTYIFESQQVSPAIRTRLFVDLLDYIMETIILHHPKEKGLQLVHLILFESPHINYENGFNEELVNDIVEAAILVLEQHPDLASQNLAVQEILRQVMGAMQEAGYTHWQELPQLFRLIVQYSALNADLIIIPTGDTPNYVLITALQQLLIHLGDQGSPDSWSPHLTEADIHIILENTFALITQHPDWIAMIKGDKGVFDQVLTTVFDALFSLPAEERLTPDTLEFLIQLALRTVANNPKVLDSIHWSEDQREVVILQKTLDLIFGIVFQRTSYNGYNKMELLEELLAYCMETVIVHHPDEKGLVLIHLILFENTTVDYSQGFNATLADQLIDSTLHVLHTYPHLVTHQIAIQAVISDLTGALSASSFRDSNILPELVRLTLEKTGQNAHLIIQTEDDQPQFLLLLALQLLLEKLSYREEGEHWSPQLTEQEALSIANILTDELVNHPEWMYASNDTTSLFNQVIDTLFNTLAKMPHEERFSADTLELLFRNILRTVGDNPTILNRVDWGKQEEKAIIYDMVLDIVFSYVFSTDENDEFYFDNRQSLFVDLIQYTFGVVLTQHPDKKGLLLIQLILFEDPKLDLHQPFDSSTADEVINSALKVLAARPELVAKEAIFQKLVGDIALALRQSGLKRDYLFNEFLRLSLWHIGNNADLLLNIRTTGPKHLLSETLKQVLKALASPPKKGKWKPQLSDEQILAILDEIFTLVALNPQWVNNNEFILNVLAIIHDSLEVLPKNIKLNHSTYVLLIMVCLKAASLRKQLIIEFIALDGSQQQIALEYSLKGLFIELYDNDGQSAGSWALTQTEAMNAITEYYLLRLSSVPTTQAEIDKAKGKIHDAIDAINNNLAFTLEELLKNLQNTNN